MPICHQKGSDPAHYSRTPSERVSSRAQQLALNFKWLFWSSQSVAQMRGVESQAIPVTVPGHMAPSGQLPMAQHSWGCSAPTCAVGQSAFPCKKVKQGWKWLPRTPGLPLESPLRLWGCVFPARGQMLPWMKWFTPNHHHQDLHWRKADGTHKCMWKLPTKAGESQYRKAAGCKALIGTVSSRFCPFAGELQNVPVRVRWPCQSDIFITKEFIHKKSTQMRPHD